MLPLSPFTHPYTLPPIGRYGSSTYWDARCILAHRDEGSKRLYLVVWAGTDEKKQPWPNLWEPTKNIKPWLRKEYYDRIAAKAKAPKQLIDVSPLDTLVQRRISHAVVHEQGASFGTVHRVYVDELSLEDLAVYYCATACSRSTTWRSRRPSTRRTR